MNLAKHAGFGVGLFLVIAQVGAQTITGYEIGKEYTLTQTSSTAPVAVSGAPYDFYARIAGTNLSSLPTPSFTKTNSSSVTSVKDLAFDPTVQKWKFNSSGNDTPADLSDSFFTSSTAYPFTINGNTATFTFPATDDFVATHPQITSGTWINNSLTFDPTEDYSLNFNSFSPSLSALDSEIRLQITGPGLPSGGLEDVTLGSVFGNISLLTNLTISANTLQTNSVYSADLFFLNIEGENTTAVPGITGCATYRDDLKFNIATVPEPADFAALAGATALALGVLVRRRKVVAQE